MTEVWFDAHCHLDAPAFDEDRDAVWRRAESVGVRGALIPAVDPAGWARACNLAQHGSRWVALGIHPHCVPTLSREAVRAGLDALERTAREHRGCVVAIGECGLDGAVDLERAPWDFQREVLLAHIEVARALDLPLALHVFHAHDVALQLLRAVRLPSRPGMIHSYSGDATLVERYLELGFYLSFAGSITRPTAKRPVRALRAVPDDRLLVETDAPDQTPSGVAADAWRCEPMHLTVTARRAAELRETTPERLAAITTRNAEALFGVECRPP